MFWYEEEVKRVERERDTCGYKPETVFFGSSSIREWNKFYEDFHKYKPLNLGFGGSTLAACVWYFDRILAPLHQLEHIIVYAGDNDLGDGRHPEEVFIFYQQLISKLKVHFGDIRCGIISIKPSLSRWHIIDRIRFTNQLIEQDIARQQNGLYFINVYDQMIGKNGYPIHDLFQHDGLHLSARGYKLWKNILLTHSSFAV